MDERLRIPHEGLYVEALGLAAFAFARCEWNAVWCCQQLQPGYITSVGRKTAGHIAGDLIKLAASASNPAWADELRNAAAEFKGVVDVRNALMHANPGTDIDGGQRLFRDGKPWQLSDINDAADQFTRCSLSLNAILHTHLLP